MRSPSPSFPYSQGPQDAQSTVLSPHIRAQEPLQEAQNRPPLEVQYLPGEKSELFDPPSSCQEQPHIRLAYLSAIATQVLYNAPQAAAEFSLNSMLDGYRLAGNLPARPKPVTTLPSVRRRLGIDIESYITQRPMCSECYFIYTFDEIKSSGTPACTQVGCNGVFWKTPPDNQSLRTPVCVAAYCSVLASLRRLFMRPDFLASLDAGRRAHESHLQDDTVLHDICDGTGWCSESFGLERHVDELGTVSDSRVAHSVSLGFGLYAGLNLDWFRITESYSVGGLYLSILNLH